jgi:GTPase SAR1 family protein
MKNLLLLLLLLVSVKANAEITSRNMKIACGSDAELQITLKNYKEMPVIFSYNTNANYIYSLFVNFETETSTWVVKLAEENTYCVLGVGDKIDIPNLGKSISLVK